MNEFIHFATGYLIGRIKKYNHYDFEIFFLSICAIIPDFDYIIILFIPNFEHGVITHTLFGGFALVLLFSSFTWIILRNFLKIKNIQFKTLLILGIFGLISHFILDSFTYYESTADSRHHMYFWPISSYAPHINILFPTATYQMRVIVEVAYSVLIGSYILIYEWFYLKKNPFQCFFPSNWNKKNKNIIKSDDTKSMVPILSNIKMEKFESLSIMSNIKIRQRFYVIIITIFIILMFISAYIL